MRRVAGLTLAGLGVVLIAVAVVIPTYVSAQIVKFPLDEHSTATLAGTGVSYFSQAKLKQITGVSVQATYTIKGDAGAGSSSTAVWNQASSARDVTNGLPVSSMTRRFAFDRRTGQLVNCCGAHVNGNKAIRQTGLVGYVFPFGTQPRTYQVFDTTLNRTVPFTYSGPAVTEGIPTYMFTESVRPTQVATVTVPGPFFGLKPKTVKLPVMYQIHLVYWVDPETGALLNVDEHEKRTLQNPADGATVAVLFDGDLVATPATVREVVARDSSGRTELALLNTTIPVAAGSAAGLALIAGIILLAWKPRRDTGAAPGGPGPAEPSPRLAADQ